jgi:hypothetical protein
MPTPPLSDADKRAAYEASLKHERAIDAAASLGLSDGTYRHRLRAAMLDPGIAEALADTGISPENARHGWTRVHNPETGNWNSVFWKLPDGDEANFREAVTETLKDVLAGQRLDLPRKFTQKAGNLLVLDPADVHIGKLSVESETGHAYDERIARHRLVEGSRALMEWGQREGVTRVLFVMGNDIAHIDNPKRTTTSGTPQDANASYFEIYRVAQAAYVEIVRMGLEMGLTVDVVHVPSNHDWTLGWTIAQAVGLLFQDHPNVGASAYSLSERNRKYYRFENNLVGLTHHDGAKESTLGDLMRTEARPHIGECSRLYWYLHHYHHKIRKASGVQPRDREKDHFDMTVLRTGAGEMAYDNIQLEVVRSPSPPDGWHDRNGYVNMQAVEAFIHHPFDGQILRKTEWF